MNDAESAKLRSEGKRLAAENSRLSQENESLRGELHLLRFKMELLVDMVTLANLDCDQLQVGWARARTHAKRVGGEGRAKAPARCRNFAHACEPRPSSQDELDAKG